jgi:hypothetical protein
MSITDAKRDLLDGWIAQAVCYRELDQADLVDLTHDLRTALMDGQPAVSEVPVFIRARRAAMEQGQ